MRRCVAGARGGGGGSVAAGFAMITTKTRSSAPIRYAAAQTTMGAGGVWTKVGRGAAHNNVFYIKEQGVGGQACAQNRVMPHSHRARGSQQCQSGKSRRGAAHRGRRSLAQVRAIRRLPERSAHPQP